MKNQSMYNKFIIFKDKFNKKYFSKDDLVKILHIKSNTANWLLWKWKNENLIFNIDRGKYSLKKENITPKLSITGENIYNLLLSEGVEFFISGIDIIQVFMQHIPEKFPILLFTNEIYFQNIYDILQDNKLLIITDKKYKEKYEAFNLNNYSLVILRKTKELKYQQNHLAIFEKAFFDTYYEITRNNYPLSLQELSKIYVNIKRKIYFNNQKLIQIASRKHLENEFKMIVEYNKINKKAFEFINYLKNIEQNHG